MELFQLFQEQARRMNTGAKFNPANLIKRFGRLSIQTWEGVFKRTAAEMKARNFNTLNEWPKYCIFLRNISGSQGFLNSNKAYDPCLDEIAKTNHYRPRYPSEIYTGNSQYADVFCFSSTNGLDPTTFDRSASQPIRQTVEDSLPLFYITPGFHDAVKNRFEIVLSFEMDINNIKPNFAGTEKDPRRVQSQADYPRNGLFFTYLQTTDLTEPNAPTPIEFSSLKLKDENGSFLTNNWIDDKIAELNKNLTKIGTIANGIKSIQNEVRNGKKSQSQADEAIARIIPQKSVLRTELILFELNSFLERNDCGLHLFSTGPQSFSRYWRKVWLFCRGLPKSLMNENEAANELRNEYGLDKNKPIYWSYMNNTPIVTTALRVTFDKDLIRKNDLKCPENPSVKESCWFDAKIKPINLNCNFCEISIIRPWYDAFFSTYLMPLSGDSYLLSYMASLSNINFWQHNNGYHYNAISSRLRPARINDPVDWITRPRASKRSEMLKFWLKQEKISDFRGFEIRNYPEMQTSGRNIMEGKAPAQNMIYVPTFLPASIEYKMEKNNPRVSYFNFLSTLSRDVGKLRVKFDIQRHPNFREQELVDSCLGEGYVNAGFWVGLAGSEIFPTELSLEKVWMKIALRFRGNFPVTRGDKVKHWQMTDLQKSVDCMSVLMYTCYNLFKKHSN